MSPDRLAATLAVLLAFGAAEAGAQPAAGAGLQYFHWSEETSPIGVRESGPVFAVSLDLQPRREAPWRPAYHGEAGIGVGDYHGSSLDAPRVPVTTTTLFGATSHEGQLRLRAPRELTVVGALGFSWWHRQLSLTEREDYATWWLALSLERRDPEARGWSGGGGVRLPLDIREEAHFTDRGYDRDPVLAPGKRAGLFARVRHRFTPRLSWTASLDAFRLGASSPVTLTVSGRTVATAFQPTTTLLLLGTGVEGRW